jgi:metalloendopeptidase OMA1, mitochondrial
MKKYSKCIMLFLVLCFASCAPGRPRIPLGEVPPAPVPTRQEQSQAAQFKRELMESDLLSNDRKYTERVSRITNRILSVVDTSHQWDTFVIKEDSFNAATLLGSIILVNTGLLDMLEDDNEVAAVMGHEVAHSLASHFRRTRGEIANEIIAAVLGVAAGAAAIHYGAGEGGVEQSVYLTQALMRGAIVNPHSRENEREADRIGIFAMADAGYDPRAAVRIWERMAQEGSAGSLAFFSTHPPSAERADLLRQILPMALSRYEKSKEGRAASAVQDYGTGSMHALQRAVRQEQSRESDVKMRIERARGLLGNSQYQEAELMLRDLVREDATNPEGVYLLGLSLLEQNRHSEAREFLIKAVGLNFNNPEPAYSYARVMARLGEKQNAIAYLARACNLNNSLRARAATEPDFVSLRGDERFTRIVNR